MLESMGKPLEESLMRRSRGNRGSANFGCIVWLVILGLVGYVLWKVVPVKIATSEFYDVMQEQAAFGSIKDPKMIEFAMMGAVNWIAKWFDPAGPMTSDHIGDAFADYLVGGLKK